MNIINVLLAGFDFSKFIAGVVSLGYGQYLHEEKYHSSFPGCELDIIKGDQPQIDQQCGRNITLWYYHLMFLPLRVRHLGTAIRGDPLIISHSQNMPYNRLGVPSSGWWCIHSGSATWGTPHRDRHLGPLIYYIQTCHRIGVPSGGWWCTHSGSAIWGPPYRDNHLGPLYIISKTWHTPKSPRMSVPTWPIRGRRIGPAIWDPLYHFENMPLLGVAAHLGIRHIE